MHPTGEGVEVTHRRGPCTTSLPGSQPTACRLGDRVASQRTATLFEQLGSRGVLSLSATNLSEVESREGGPAVAWVIAEQLQQRLGRGVVIATAAGSIGASYEVVRRRASFSAASCARWDDGAHGWCRASGAGLALLRLP